MTNREIAVAAIDERVVAAEKAGLRATAESWQQYRRNAEARPDNEIIVAATRFGPTSTSPGSWSSATGKF
jgi:hypothetical protein